MKLSKYMIVQFVPDPITGERINIGVIAFDDQSIECRFLNNWNRVKCFAGGDFEFLKDFAETTEKSLAGTSPLDLGLDKDLGQGRAFTPELLARMSSEWAGSIQLTPPKLSPRPRQVVLDWAASRLLTDSKSPRIMRHIADGEMRNRILKIVQHQAKNILLPDMAATLLHTDYLWKGNLEEHTFKAALANGKNLAGFDAISMDNPTRGIVQASRLKWALSDIRKRDKETPLVVTIFPPKEDLSEYRSLMKTIKDLDGDPVPYDEAEGKIADVFNAVVPEQYRFARPQVRTVFGQGYK